MKRRIYMAAEAVAEVAAAGAAAKPEGQAVVPIPEKPPEKKAEAVPVAPAVPIATAPPAPIVVAKVEPKPAPTIETLDTVVAEAKSKLDAISARHEKQLRDDTIAKLRRMGADPDVVNDAMLRKVAPTVDPESIEGEAALLKFKQENVGFFQRVEVGPQESLAKYTQRVQADTTLTPRQKERRERMAKKLLGGA